MRLHVRPTPPVCKNLEQDEPSSSAQPRWARAGQPFTGTLISATVFAPQVTLTVSTAALPGIVAATSHQSSGAPKPLVFCVMVGAIDAVVPETSGGPSTAW